MASAPLEASIAAGDRLLLDTTVLAAYLDAGDATHQVARTVIDELVASGRNPAVISMVTVMELLIRPLRATPPGHHTVLAFLGAAPHLTCVPIDLQVAQDAAHLRAGARLAPPDTLIVGTGIATQVRHLLTNDRAWSTRLAPLQPRIGVVLLSDHVALPRS